MTRKRKTGRTTLLLAATAVATLLAYGMALAAAGNLDPSFGGDGRVTTTLGEDASASDLIVQPDGKLVAAGDRSVSLDSAFALTRHNPDGSLDKGFGTNGRVVTVGDGDWRATALARQRGRKLVVAGYGFPSGGSASGPSFIVVARYNPGGSLDRTFGDGGAVTTGFEGNAEPSDLIVQPDGKLVVAGNVQRDFDQFNRPRESDFVVVRYKRDGSLDEGFGEGGKVVTDRSNQDGFNALVLGPDGKLVAAGYAFLGGDAYYDFALARYNPDGSPDRSFGRGGVVTTSMGWRYDSVNALALLPSGRLVAAGSGGGVSRSTDFALARYKPDGSLDGTFGRAGKVTTDFIGKNDAIASLVVQPDGKLAVAGDTTGDLNDPYGGYFALARYHPRGALDGTFGTGGKLRTGFPGSVEASADALVRQRDGKLVAAGSERTRDGNRDTYRFALARYLP